MINKNYQTDYSAGRPQMYDEKSRKIKAQRIVKLLENFFGKKVKLLTILDIGASTGIIDFYLSEHFSKIVGTDIDKKAIEFAKRNFIRKNLKFETADAMKLKYKDKSFDIVICTHVYEHVSNPQKLFTEIRRVLKPSGVCYLAAVNKWWPIEAHYNLPFLSWLPKSLANYYVRITGRANTYYETPFSYTTLKKLTYQFEVSEFTDKILKEPGKYGYEDILPKGKFVTLMANILSPLGKYFSPTFFWLLQKN